jgi:uncharacterized membrane protein
MATMNSSSVHDELPSEVSQRQQPGLPNSSAIKLARGLGWFSVSLGLTELLFPNVIANITGVSKERTGLIRWYGLRELASGIAIFKQKKPVEAMWSRVAGDAIDLASLGAAFKSPDANKARLTFAAINVLGVTALDVICARQLSASAEGIQVSASCIVNKSPEEVYDYWRNFSNLPRFMKHLESVEDLGDGRSRWIAKGPAGTSVKWDATIIGDDPGTVITWRSTENADVDNAGAVRFEAAPGGRGTIVRVNLAYNPPAGVVGAVVAKLFGEAPDQQIYDDLRRFKQIMEVGEVVVSDSSILGSGYFEQRPGQPASGEELETADMLPSESATKSELARGMNQ